MVVIQGAFLNKANKVLLYLEWSVRAYLRPLGQGPEKIREPTMKILGDCVLEKGRQHVQRPCGRQCASVMG